MHSSQTAVAVAVGVLASVFIAALLALLMICRNKFCFTLAKPSSKKQNIIDKESFDIRPDIHLISSQELDDLDYLDGVDPEDFSIHPDLEKLVESHRWKWVDDALGVVPHCLSMLKGCHHMSERLTTTAMGTTDPKRFNEVALMARGVIPLVDDMLRSMCPPINPHQVEERAAALLQGISQLSKLTQRTCGMSWPSAIVNEMNTHYQALREIANQNNFGDSDINNHSAANGTVPAISTSAT